MTNPVSVSIVEAGHEPLGLGDGTVLPPYARQITVMWIFDMESKIIGSVSATAVFPRKRDPDGIERVVQRLTRALSMAAADNLTEQVRAAYCSAMIERRRSR